MRQMFDDKQVTKLAREMLEKQMLTVLPRRIEVANIEAMEDDQLTMLKCGDVVVKQTANMRHCYTVTYKEDNVGICLSYYAAGYLETISYDFVENHWVFNSKDVWQAE